MKRGALQDERGYESSAGLIRMSVCERRQKRRWKGTRCVSVRACVRVYANVVYTNRPSDYNSVYSFAIGDRKATRNTTCLIHN
jgi:hypothetical protein